jgi:succinate-acetate transporter protein
MSAPWIDIPLRGDKTKGEIVTTRNPSKEVVSQALTEPDELHVALSSLGDPSPIGLGGFGLTLFVLSFFLLGIAPASLQGVVLPLALFWGGLAQLLAGMWSLRNRNTFSGMVHTSYGVFWIAYATYVHDILPTLPKAQSYEATGLFLLAWTILTLYLMVAALKTNVAIVATFVVLLVLFIVLTVATYAKSTTLTKVGGGIAMLDALMAFYLSAGITIQSVWGRSPLPFGRSLSPRDS